MEDVPPARTQDDVFGFTTLYIQVLYGDGEIYYDLYMCIASC